ncbi:MAG: signal recognition particle-docking protein FtsY [Erysipelothrix sp.]|jgi:fused signal recognition particle receptor|nr:signal recognition particle-docking protein FtsY [Erysipelothrix sp.]
MAFLDQLRRTFSKKKDKDAYLTGLNAFKKKTDEVFSGLFEEGRVVDEAWLEDVVIALLQSDVSLNTANAIVEAFRKAIKVNHQRVDDTLKSQFMEVISEFYGDFPLDVMMSATGPTVILIVGVNGSGKTTTVAKLAAKYKREGHKVGVVAADTFRAGAIDQLKLWAAQIDVDFIGPDNQSDPSAVLVDAARYAKAHDLDILLCDTAGRLHNKANLMAELNKMFRVLDREITGAPHAIWLIVDATTGQNGLNQARVFLESCDVGGIILTKLDGSAKGGIILSIKHETDIGVIFVGLGEKLEDLVIFDKEAYLYSMFEGVLYDNKNTSYE